MIDYWSFDVNTPDCTVQFPDRAVELPDCTVESFVYHLLSNGSTGDSILISFWLISIIRSMPLSGEDVLYCIVKARVGTGFIVSA